KQYAIYRKSTVEQELNQNNLADRNQYVSVLGTVKLSYPFDVYNSIRLSGTLRNDRAITLATDASSLEKKIDDAQRFGLKLEWVFDNTRVLDINSRRGTRAKVWTEVVKRFDLNLFEEGRKLQFNKGFMTVIGFDARHYVSLDRRSIFAIRGTGATSLGSERILYYLGGVENWLFPSFDRGVIVPGGINFAYTSIAANMRGFKYNARNGSSVVLANAELRVPVLQYLSRQKIRSSFLRNIQLVGFVDAGTAWHGPDPFGPDNPLNTVVLTNPPTVEVIVNYYRNPLIVGYGGGIRTMLFGYLLKVDYGWNWETKTNRKPLLHFSMGADF
ncbi:MAG: BamA/TamA family outer membrane protein, partial [Saprospiraceae bacterium]